MSHEGWVKKFLNFINFRLYKLILTHDLQEHQRMC